MGWYCVYVNYYLELVITKFLPLRDRKSVV